MKAKIIFILSLFIYSCNNKKEEKSTQEVKNESLDSAYYALFEKNKDSTFLDTEEKDEEIIDTILNIKFEDLSLVISPFATYPEDSVETKIHKDTLKFIVDLGETIENRKIIVKSKKLKNIQLFIKYETSISISNEGPHCDLIDWKHYYSDWEKVFEVSKNEFLTREFLPEENEKFIDININELKSKVKKDCGKNYYDLVKNLKSVNEGASGAYISHYYLKIIGKDIETDKEIKKIIIIENQIGC